MENIYALSGKYAEINDRYEALSAELDAMYEDNGGEETAETEQMQELLQEQEALKAEVLREIVEHADDYAEIALNKASQQKILEAELKAVKEEQAKVVAKYQARINRIARSVEFWKENFQEAMKVEQLTKIGGPKTGHKFTIWVKESESIDVDEAVALAPFEEKIAELVEQLPAWVKIATGVNKTVLKKEETLPEGASRVVSQSIQIR